MCDSIAESYGFGCGVNLHAQVGFQHLSQTHLRFCGFELWTLHLFCKTNVFRSAALLVDFQVNSCCFPCCTDVNAHVTRPNVGLKRIAKKVNVFVWASRLVVTTTYGKKHAIREPLTRSERWNHFSGSDGGETPSLALRWPFFRLLLVTSATLVVTGALLVVTRNYWN